MMRKLRSAAILLLAAALCSASVFCTGCANNNSVADQGGSIYTPEVPESRVDEDEPGNEYVGSIGETVNYVDKLDK